MNQRLREPLAERTGRTVEEITRGFDRDRYMTAQEAKEYGLVDEVLASASTLGRGERRGSRWGEAAGAASYLGDVRWPSGPTARVGTRQWGR